MTAKTSIFIQISLFLIQFNSILSKKEVYEGTSFPRKYFLAETLVPTSDDLESYLLGTKKIIQAISSKPNRTDVNRALGVFYMKAILKRTVMENEKKLNNTQLAKIKELIKLGDQIMGYYFYKSSQRKWSDGYYRVLTLFRDDTVQTETIGEFNRNHLARWLVNTSNTINKFARAFDELTLSKEKYVALVESVITDKFTIQIQKSDLCLSMVVYNRVYFDKHFRPCTADKSCADVLYRSPSVAYGLSHRMLNIIMPRQNRRCYIRSKESDDTLLEVLCASMYRETVYLARKGYMYRDLFLEHMALCGLLGYREFFRLHWFRKVLSWINKDGCIKENMNFEYVRSNYLIKRAKTEKKKDRYRQNYRILFKKSCSFHQMALSLMMLAHGIRYAVEFMA